MDGATFSRQPMPETYSSLVKLDTEIFSLRSTLEAVQVHMLKRISSLCCQRNVQVPFNSLPNELLGSILAHATMAGGAKDSTMPLGLVRLRELSMVCQRWKQVINSFPALWTSVGGTSVEVALQLRKSGVLPLNIQYNAISGNADFFLNMVMPHRHRWSSIEFSTRSEGDLEALMRILRSPLPKLRCIALQYEGYYIQAPPTLQLCEDNALEEISLQCLVMPPRPAFLRTLRHLSLGLPIGCHPSFILPMLASAPVLESFKLFQHAGPPVTIPNMEYDPIPLPVHLANIQTVELIDLCFLWHLSFCSHVRADKLRHYRALPIPDDAGQVFNELLRHDGLIYRVLANSNVDDAEISLRNDVDHDELKLVDKSRALDILVTTYNSRFTQSLDTSDKFASFVRKIPSVRLHLVQAHIPEEGTTVAFLSKLESLRSIRLECTEQGLLPFIRTMSHTNGGKSICPFLNRIDIQLLWPCNRNKKRAVITALLELQKNRTQPVQITYEKTPINTEL